MKALSAYYDYIVFRVLSRVPASCFGYFRSPMSKIYVPQEGLYSVDQAGKPGHPATGVRATYPAGNRIACVPQSTRPSVVSKHNSFDTWMKTVTRSMADFLAPGVTVLTPWVAA